MSADMYVAKIPKEQLVEWLNSPTTKVVFKVLTDLRNDYQNTILNGNSLDLTSVEKTSLNTALILGNISGLNKLLNILVEDKND